MKYTITLIALALALALAACGGSSPSATASGLLSKTDATASGPAYVVTPVSQSAECNNGDAEADGTLTTDGGQDVFVCVFPSEGQLTSYLNGGMYAASAGIVEVGTNALVLVVPENLTTNPPPASLMATIASDTGGQQYLPGS